MYKLHISIKKLIFYSSVLLLIMFLIAITGKSVTSDSPEIFENKDEIISPEVAGVSDSKDQMTDSDQVPNKDFSKDAVSSLSQEVTHTVTPTLIPTQFENDENEVKGSSVIKTHVRVINPNFPSPTDIPAD